MNRTIKFRGRCLDGKSWLYGDLAHKTYHNEDGTEETWSYINAATREEEVRLLKNAICSYAVDPETVGQFTGLLDRNGEEVYEGDVVFWIATDMRGRGSGQQGAIFWDKHTMSWAIERDKPCIDGRPCIISRPFDKRHLEVVGNIHDNPELMGNEQSKS